MINDLIDTLLDIAGKHISVNYTAYKRSININDLHNEPSMQFIITDDGLLEKQVVDNVTTIRFGIYILGFVGNNSSLSIQDEATHIAMDYISYLNNHIEYGIEVVDYALAGLSEYSDNSCSGVYLTLKLIIPTPVNLCEYEEHFIEKEEPVKEDIIIDPTNDECTNTPIAKQETTLRLNPLKLM